MAYVCPNPVFVFVQQLFWVLSLRVFLSIFSTASIIFTAKKVCKDFGERELLYLPPRVLGEMDIRSFH